MIITLVIDQYGNANNGTTVTSMHLAETLRKHGNEVRVVTASFCDDPGVYKVDKYVMPIFQPLIESQGMILAHADREVLKNAIEGSDIVHFLMPFKLSIVGKEICDEMGIPSTAAFHVQPENITSTIYLNKSKFINKTIYKKFRTLFYDKFQHIHCPSFMIKNQLEKNHYHAKLHVISNGVSDLFTRQEVEKPVQFNDKFTIMMVGRYSREKRQDLIIEAVKESKYKDIIQLVLVGKGPWKENLVKLSSDLPNIPIFTFLPQKDLVSLINACDLYVHASDVEIEAISCIEAFSCGLVPIISDSKLTATNQFAQDERCLFKHGNAKDLAKKIDYMIEHEDVRKELSDKYVEYGKTFKLENCVNQMEDMFKEAIRDFNNEKK